VCVTPNPTISLQDEPNGFKMAPALRLFQSQFIISPVLRNENGNNIITHPILFRRKISHQIILLQELAIMFCIRKLVPYLHKLMYYI
jgi:hypothetical protein